VAKAKRRWQWQLGPRLERYDERFDNLLVTYGGENQHLIDEVDAAVSSLR
jgi:hypothetical protein